MICATVPECGKQARSVMSVAAREISPTVKTLDAQTPMFRLPSRMPIPTEGHVIP